MTDAPYQIKLSVEEAIAVISHTTRLGYPTGHEKRVIAAAHNLIRETATKAGEREWSATLDHRAGIKP